MPFKSWKQELTLFAAAMLGAAVYQYLENLSIFYTSPASVSFISAVAPIFTALLAHRFLKERLNWQILVGMFVSLVGIFFICFGDSKTIETGLLGDLIIFFSVWMWAVYSIVIKKIAAYGYSDFLVTRRLFFYSVIVLLPFMIPRLSSLPYEKMTEFSVWGNLLFLGVAASALCFAFWGRSVEHLGATVTSKYMFIMPIITLIAQVIVDDSSIGVFAYIGMAVTLLGLGLTKLNFPKKKG